MSANDLAPDPTDPVQSFDDEAELRVDTLDVDALTVADAEAAEDLAVLDAESANDDADISEYGTPRAAGIGGDVFAIHVAEASDHRLSDEDRGNAVGENWFERLQADAVEDGPDPEEIVDPEAMEAGPHDTRDIPVADLGVAGPRGL